MTEAATEAVDRMQEVPVIVDGAVVGTAKVIRVGGQVNAEVMFDNDAINNDIRRRLAGNRYLAATFSRTCFLLDLMASERGRRMSEEAASEPVRPVALCDRCGVRAQASLWYRGVPVMSTCGPCAYIGMPRRPENPKNIGRARQ